MTSGDVIQEISDINSNKEKAITNLRNHLYILLVLSFLAESVLIYQAYGSGTFLGYFLRGRLLRSGLVVLTICLSGAGLLVLRRWRIAELLLSGWGWLRRIASRSGWINLVLFLAPGIFFFWWSWNPNLPILSFVAPRFWLLAMMAYLGAFFLDSAFKKVSFNLALVVTLLCYGVFYSLAQYIPQVSTYPLSMGWSEGSDFYYASLFFAKSIYGTWLPLPVLDPSRYLLQSVPFIIPSLPLWFHRLWQVFLWIGITAGGATLLVRRLAISKVIIRWVVAAWFFLYFMLGPVYYNLLICLLPLFWGFDRRRFGRSLILVLACSIWAGISRVNWLPVPGMIAAALYFLEEPADGRHLLQYLARPAGWGLLGTGAAYLAQTGYQLFSGNPAYFFGTSFNEPLLWYRLFPSATDPLGVLPALMIAALPALLFQIVSMARNSMTWHPIRRWALITEELVLFCGGIVVSVKIGGGANIHNLDAFLILLVIISGYIFFDRFVPDNNTGAARLSLSWAAQIILLIPPLFFAFRPSGSITFPDTQSGVLAVDRLQQLVASVKNKPGEVLFIGERQLITFRQIRGVTLVPQYEKVYLMEMAMADNQPYLTEFQDDLENHRFSLIVTETLKNEIQTTTHVFGEENDVWVERIVRPILQYYYPLEMVTPTLEVLAPK